MDYIINYIVHPKWKTVLYTQYNKIAYTLYYGLFFNLTFIVIIWFEHIWKNDVDVITSEININHNMREVVAKMMRNLHLILHFRLVSIN